LLKPVDGVHTAEAVMVGDSASIFEAGRAPGAALLGKVANEWAELTDWMSVTAVICWGLLRVIPVRFSTPLPKVACAAITVRAAFWQVRFDRLALRTGSNYLISINTFHWSHPWAWLK